MGLIKSYKGVNYQYDDSGNRISKGDITFTNDRDGKAISQSNGISFIFDHNEEIIGIKNGEVPYYFRKNLQGDVICLLDNTGNVVVRYYYDAWGNHKVFDASGVEITDTAHIGHLNPIRYRSYYYDSELGFYYLKTRYYDPSVGRFITPDYVDYVDVDEVNGLNLYAYCNNNPVMSSDPSGHSVIGALIAAFILLCTPIGGVAFQATVSAISYVGVVVASLFSPQIRKDMNIIGWNPFNTDEGLVLQSDKVSFYKGRPVFRVNGDAGFSFGALFLGRGATPNNFDFVKHEYGHTFQLAEQGPLGYLIRTVIPSVTGYIVNELGKLTVHYESLPWEYDANHFGKATKPAARASHITFWDILMMLFN